MTRKYFPEIHDSIVTDLNRRLKRTDQEIADDLYLDKMTIHHNRVRMGLPSNSRPRPTQYIVDKGSPPAKEKPNPLAVASMWLGRRLVEKPSGYWLDGRPVSLDTLMRETNALIKAKGGEQVTHSEKWRV